MDPRRRLRLRRQTTSTTLQTVRSDALADHADVQALLVATILAPVAAPLIYNAIHGARAHVLGVLLHGPLKEALAALAGPHPVVLAGRIVAANSTDVLLTGHCRQLLNCHLFLVGCNTCVLIWLFGRH